jgi:pimeloyl-ACP methyl ester carboxylesterase
MGWNTGFIDHDGVALHYWRRGRGGPLLLAHGFGDSGECWTRVAEALEDSYDIVAYDARYHGLSAAPGEAPMSRSAMAGDLLAVADGLGLEQPAIMGHSMGAMTVMLAAAAHPGRFRCAVMEDPPFWIGDPPTRPPPSTDAPAADELERLGRVQNPMWHDTEFGPWVRSKTQLRMPAGSRARLPGVDAWRTEIPKMELPALLICGRNRERMAIVNDEVAAAIQALNPLVEVVKFDHAGHNVRREAFEGFVEAVRAFLARPPQPR